MVDNRDRIIKIRKVIYAHHRLRGRLEPVRGGHLVVSHRVPIKEETQENRVNPLASHL